MLPRIALRPALYPDQCGNTSSTVPSDHLCFRRSLCSVFNDEEQWRTPRRETPPADADPDGNLSGGHCVGMSWMPSAQLHLHSSPRDCQSPPMLCSIAWHMCTHPPTHLPAHRVPGHAEASRSSSAFGGAQFWNALRSEDTLEGEVRGLLAGGCGPVVGADLLLPYCCTLAVVIGCGNV